MPDGGAIPFDHTMPGCTYADGGFHPQRSAVLMPAITFVVALDAHLLRRTAA